MKIKEMTATFGNLHKATLRPGSGFTLLSAPNESGKSTWAAFLRAMLYGFPARDRNKEGYIAEKNRYQPWSGAPMEGTLTLTWQGRDITLYRGPKGSTPWGTFTAVYTATGEAVPGLTAETCGETLLGVSREVFERTAFVGQGEAALSPSGDLEQRVAALATSGEEEVSFSRVERRLKDWLNRRKANARYGLIPELEGELAQAEEAIARQGTLLRRSQEALLEKEALEGKKAELEEQLRSHAAANAARQTERRKQAQEDYDAAQAHLDEARKIAETLPDAETLRSAQGDLKYLNTLTANLRQADQEAPQALALARQAEEAADTDPYFGGKIPPQVAVLVQQDHSEAQRLEKKPSPALWLFLGALIGAVPGIITFLLHPDPLVHWMVTMELWGKGELSTVCVVGFGMFLKWLILPGALMGLILAGIIFLLRRHSRKKALAALLDKYDVQNPDDILTRAADYNRKVEAAQELRRKYEAVETERDKLAAQKEELTNQLFDLIRPFAPDAASLFTVSAALTRALQQEERFKLAQARAEAARKLLTALPTPEPAHVGPITLTAPQGDPTTLAAQLSAVSGELDRAAAEWARLEGELHSLGDPAGWEAQRGALLEELEKRRGEYDAIAAAMDVLKEADSLLRERFSPAVNERAGHYLSLLTGGRYDKAALTRQFQALAQERGEAVPRQDLSLSGGTAQQLYLAVRLAMCELALPQSEPCPILLDDVLDPFDDERARLALDCLLEVAQTRQVLLFTCHSREKAMLEGSTYTALEA